MSKITPGKWWVTKMPKTSAIFIDTESRGAICQMVGRCDDERKANALAISKVPDMIEIIKEFMSYGNIFRAKMGHEPPYLKAQALLKELE